MGINISYFLNYPKDLRLNPKGLWGMAMGGEMRVTEGDDCLP